MSPAELESIIASFQGKRVLVIGDTILDINTYCSTRGLSAETPTIVLRQDREERSFGGAACVFRNLLALGSDVRFLTMAANGECFSTEKKEYIPTPPVEKRRFWCDSYKMLQVDRFSKIETVNMLQTIFDNALPEADIVVVADYRHGMIDEAFARHIVKSVKVPLYVSSQASQERSNHHWYNPISGKRLNLITNEKEAESCLGEIKGEINWVLTKGNRGSGAMGNVYPAISVDPVDTSGAGDAFLAAYALTNSLEFANLWAGLSCTVRGANPPTLEMARKWVAEHDC